MTMEPVFAASFAVALGGEAVPLRLLGGGALCWRRCTSSSSPLAAASRLRSCTGAVKVVETERALVTNDEPHGVRSSSAT
jgi:hypothetical protein